MSEFLFGTGRGHLSRSAEKAAASLGATLVNYTDPGCSCGRGCANRCPSNRRHWFAIADKGEPFNTRLAHKVEDAVAKAATKGDRELLGSHDDGSGVTFEIVSGYLDSILNIRHERTGHKTMNAALDALAKVCGDARIMTGSDLYTYPINDNGIARLVYVSKTDCDLDVDGSRALAAIYERAPDVIGG